MHLILNNKQLLEFRSSGFLRYMKRRGSFISPIVFWATIVNGRDIDTFNSLQMPEVSVEDIDLNVCEMCFSVYEKSKTSLLKSEISRLYKNSL